MFGGPAGTELGGPLGVVLGGTLLGGPCGVVLGGTLLGGPRGTEAGGPWAPFGWEIGPVVSFELEPVEESPELEAPEGRLNPAQYAWIVSPFAVAAAFSCA